MIIALKNLLAMQELDIQILELERSKLEFPNAVKSLEEEMDHARNQVLKSNQHLDALTRERTKVKDQIVTANLHLEKSQQRLNTIKTNKEYDAIHAEIEAQKHLVATGEKHIRRFNQEIENLQKTIAEHQKKLDKLVSDNAPHIEEFRQKIASIDSSMAQVAHQRQQIQASIPDRYLRPYNHIRLSRKNGKVLSMVQNFDRNCTICYQKLQPQVVNQIRKGDEIVYCQSCGSILVWQDNVIDQTE